MSACTIIELDTRAPRPSLATVAQQADALQVTITFDEPTELVSAELVDAAGTHLPAFVTGGGHTLTFLGDVADGAAAITVDAVDNVGNAGQTVLTFVIGARLGALSASHRLSDALRAASDPDGTIDVDTAGEPPPAAPGALEAGHRRSKALVASSREA